MAVRRAERVADEIRAAVAELLLRELKDPRIGMVTVTAVELSDDLRRARVFFSVVGDEAARQRSLAGLRSATGFVRREVAQRLRLRIAPEIVFVLDPGPERAQRLAELLRTAGQSRSDR